MTQQTFSIDDELDLDQYGLQPQDGIFVISDVDIVENQHGQRWQVYFEAEEDIEGLAGNKVRDSGYMTHATRPELVNIGMSVLKRLKVAATGEAGGPLSALIGQRVKGRVSEDSNGFARIGRLSAAE